MSILESFLSASAATEDGGFRGSSIELEDDPIAFDMMSVSGFLRLCDNQTH